MTDDYMDPAARPTRRTFSAEYKAEIVAEYDAHPKGSDERGAILRREGLYTSHIFEWRKQAEAGARDGLARKSRKRRSAEQVELDRLRRQNERLAAELKRTQSALEITGKVHALYERTDRMQSFRSSLGVVLGVVMRMDRILPFRSSLRTWWALLRTSVRSGCTSPDRVIGTE